MNFQRFSSLIPLERVLRGPTFSGLESFPESEKSAHGPIFKVQCFVFFMVILCEPQNWIWGSSENRFNVINNQKTFPLNLTVGPCILLWLEIVPVFSNHSLVKPSNRRKYRLRCMGHSYKYKKFLSVVYLWNVFP